MALDEDTHLLLLMHFFIKTTRRNGLQNAMQHSKSESRRRRKYRLRTYHLHSQQQIMMLLLLRERHMRQYRAIHSSHFPFLKKFKPGDFLERFRMSKDTFIYLCDRLRNSLNRPGITPEEKVGIALWRLSSKNRCPSLNQNFRDCRNVVNRCLKEVCQAIVTILKPIHLHPPDCQSLKDTARIFNSRWGFPHCVGALGSFAIPLSSNSRRDSTRALVLHAVVDGHGLLWEACACYPDNMSSATILENSTLWELAQERRLQTAPNYPFLGKAHNYFLLANSSYPLQSWLLTPYSKAGGLSLREEQYNLHLQRALSVAEIALLRLRARWQCLLAPSDYKMVPTVALACCVLHNLCETLEQRFDACWLEGVETMDLPVLPQSVCQSCPKDFQAESIRDAVCDYFSTQAKI
ncbi:protein ALP1-like [Bufo bufo]|uniref:protein ALP1-like n=1 Tax=Bufo bufo TaxID=8384 RepID=UPI001ABE815C|nr:protein ALP1-like [Bufo bufo]